MPYTLNLSGVRGDKLLFAVPLTSPGPPVRPLTQAEGQNLKNAWPTIEMQVRLNAADSGAAPITLTSASGDLSIDPAYPQANGETAPALVIRVPASMTGTVLTGVYDMQFSSPTDGPYTWLEGKFTLTQDVTRNA